MGSVATSPPRNLEKITIRFAGDSGDGIQVLGGQFTNTTALAGNDLLTFPDFPAEIRAPAGTIRGVSGFQIQFASNEVFTPGDRPDVLVVFNPAALKVNIGELPPNSAVIVNSDAFEEVDLRKAEYEKNPLEDGSLAKYQVIAVPITELTIRALESAAIPHKDKERAKNFFALGLVCWLFSRPIEPILKFFAAKYGAKNPEVAKANSLALQAGFSYAETRELFSSRYKIAAAATAPGLYRNVSGNEATALGLVAGSLQAGRPLFYGSYPITPATEILQELSRLQNYGVITVQAEDEIAAVCASIGASYAGAIGMTGTSGPGLALKGEAIGLATMVELPLVVVDVQRGGPSTGLPTKTEQADLMQAMYGRHGESPVAVVAPATPAECFDLAYFAVRIAVQYMCPVLVLSDGYLAFGTEPMRIPDLDSMAKIPVRFPTDPKEFAPYRRDEVTLARPWAIPGTPGLEHRVGGLEKAHIRGHISYQQDNHDLMCRLRAAKIQRIVAEVPDVAVHGPEDATTLVLGWGSTYGAIRTAVEEAQKQGEKVARAHLRHLNPFPRNLGDVLRRFRRILIPEINLGQLSFLIRGRYGVDVCGLNRTHARPFRVSEILEAVQEGA